MQKYTIIPTQTLGYYRSHRTGLIHATLKMGNKAQHITVSPTLFLAVFPAIDRRWLGDTIDAAPDELAALGFNVVYPKIDVKLADIPHQVRYVYVPGLNRYIARLLGTKQEISASARFFRKVAGVSERAVLGSVTLTDKQAAECGFVISRVEGVSGHDARVSTALYA
ncbi:hypothetical protein [Paenibacillus caui]|uniref:hypothetical protein n=1 Tax=Paenibacillus caui TaxID=2873927 RepID=UPI001CA8A5D5|nr:hypothetical protein [Paenibacillus caui]